jgi:hypothetical protein
MREKPGRTVTIRQVGSIFEKSYLKASIPQNAINGLKKKRDLSIRPELIVLQKLRMVLPLQI